MERAKAVRVARLQFTVHGEVEAESAKVQGKELFGGIVDARVGGSERVFDLFYRRCDFRGTKRQATGGRDSALRKVPARKKQLRDSPVLELYKFHVEHFDAFHALHDWIEDQPNPILG